MSIFDMFTSKPAQQNQPAQQQAPTPANPGSIPDQQTPVTQATPNTDPNGAVPNNPAPVTKDDSPLAGYETLWETIPTDPNNPAPAAHTPLDAAELQTVMAKADFSKSITPDMMEAINAGGEGAGIAFSQAMNSVVQQAMVQSTLINEKLTAQAVQRAIEATESRIPDLVRNQASAAHLNDSNPVFSNPAVKPVIDAARQQLMQKFPNDTPAMTADKLNNYVKAMTESFNPKPAPDVLEGGQDWNKFL